jgi:4-alpha-glucanotransferase
MTKRTEAARLRALARLHGIQTSYSDLQGRRVLTPEPTLRALLAALGVPAESEADCKESWDAALQRQRYKPVDDVVVAWDGLLTHVDVTLTGTDATISELLVALEDGATLAVDVRNCRVEPLGGAGTGTCELRRVRLHTALRLPAGYHRLVCSSGGRSSSSLLLAAPMRCYDGETGEGRLWGLFAPLYALRSDTDCGAGSYSELQELSRYTAHRGGGLAGTLPLLPCRYETGGEPSPYLPLTRLLWSEFYIDIDRIPFLSDCPEAMDVLNTEELAQSRAALRQAPLVDYVAIQHLKRTVLRAVYQRLSSCGELQSSIDGFLASRRHAARYAAFCATHNRLQVPWQQWPFPARDGDLAEGLIDVEDRRFGEFEQWLAHEQMAACVERSRAQGAGLYLDLPVGVHPEGYDTWRFRDSFVSRAATGAPPDSVFTTGQKWGSPPLHPVTIREHHYDYVREYLEHHMRAARMLRIDHVIGLHHIFCIPEGAEPSMGAYLRYRPEEWYAILSIESHRHKTLLVGEDLGLVPREVRRSMARHGLSRMFVLYYEMDGIAAGRVPEIPDNCLASLNTHDMPSFAAMWQGLDISQHIRVGIVKPELAPSARVIRRRAVEALLGILKSVCPDLVDAQDLDVVLRCTLGWLGVSRARYVMVNLEDLWHETAQQNIPGVGAVHPSWRQRVACTLEEIWRSPRIGRTLEMLQHAVNPTGMRR